MGIYRAGDQEKPLIPRSFFVIIQVKEDIETEHK